MEFIDNDIDLLQRVELTFQVKEHKYLRATLSTKNDWSKEIIIQLNKV